MINPIQDKSRTISRFTTIDRVVRGGMWDHGLYFLSGQMRHGNPPTARRFAGLGFRMARNKK